MADDDVIRQRLVNDERLLKRCLKSFLDIAASAMKEEPERASSIKQAYQTFQTELALYEASMSRAHIISDMNLREVSNYEQMCEDIQLECERVKRDIIRLSATRDEEQASRRNKLEYDALTEKVNEFPARAETTQLVQQLEEDIRQLEEEHVFLNERAILRAKQLQGFLWAMSSLQDEIKLDDMNQSDLALFPELTQLISNTQPKADKLLESTTGIAEQQLMEQ